MTRDLTRGNPTKLIIYFTIPLLLGNIFQQFYSMADTIIVGRTVGVNALAAVGATGSLSFLIIGFAQGLTAGLSVITAQKFGAEDYNGVRKSVTTSILLSVIITFILTSISVCFARPILEIMNTPSEIIDDAYNYIVIIFWGIGASVVFNLLSNIIRALGDSKTPLLFLIIACILNIALDFVLILYFSMGVSGAAVATVIAQVLSSLLCLFYINKKLPILKIKKKHWLINRALIYEHTRMGLPMAFQASIIAIGAMILQSTLNTLGAASVAAFTAAQKIDILATQPLMSFGITMSTYAAQNFGAKNIERIKIGIKKCIKISVSFSLISGFILILIGKSIVRIFVGSDAIEVINLSQYYLITNCSMYFVLALLFIYRYTLQGLGKSFVPTVAGIAELIMRTFAALILADKLGFLGICLASPIAWIGAVIPLGFSYFSTMKKLSNPSSKILEAIN